MSLALRARGAAAAARYYARRALRRPSATLEQVAEKTVELSAAGELDAVPIFFREDQLPRIADSPAFPASAIINEHLSRQTIELHPLRVHEVRNAVLVDGSLYAAGRMRMELRTTALHRRRLDGASLIPKGRTISRHEAALTGGVAGSTWFGHWLEDELPLHLLARGYAPAVAHERPEFGHESRYRQLLELEAPERAGVAHIRRLTVVDEFAQNPHKARRYWQIRQRLSRIPTGSSRIFLNRGTSGTSRALSNELEVADRLRSEGFRVIDVGADLDTLLGALRGCDLVVSVEGSHLAHALYAMNTFGTMVILNPPARVYTTVADIAPFCELHAAMFICTAEPSGTFRADPDELLSFIDQAANHAKSRRAELERFLHHLRDYPVADPPS